jgi:hypothetical protein
MPYKFNPPPGWPLPPPGWQPGPDWKPDPSWPAPPVGWSFWVDEPAAAPQAQSRPPVRVTATVPDLHVYQERYAPEKTAISRVRDWTPRRKIGVAVLGVIIVAIVAIHLATEQSPGQHACEVLRASMNATTNAAETANANELASIAASGSVGGQLGTDLATWNNTDDSSALGAVAQDCQDYYGINVYPPQ